MAVSQAREAVEILQLTPAPDLDPVEVLKAELLRSVAVCDALAGRPDDEVQKVLLAERRHLVTVAESVAGATGALTPVTDRLHERPYGVKGPTRDELARLTRTERIDMFDAIAASATRRADALRSLP